MHDDFLLVIYKNKNIAQSHSHISEANGSWPSAMASMLPRSQAMIKDIKVGTNSS